MPSGNPPRSQTVVPNTPAQPVRPSASSSATVNGDIEMSLPPVSSDGMAQASINEKLRNEYVLSVSRCNTIGELVRLIPVPTQPTTRELLDAVYQAAQKLGGAEVLLATWRDRLRLGEVDKVAPLNSLKAPVVQVCKEALTIPDNGLSSMNLDSALVRIKKEALSEMIRIKDQEVGNLRAFVQSRAISERIRVAWDAVLAKEAGMITAEHAALLREDQIVFRIAQTAASIGESSHKRALLSKQKRTSEKKDKAVEMTNFDAESKKQFSVLIEETLKRREQSRRDRARSGKGKRAAGSPKTKIKAKGLRPKDARTKTRNGGGPIRRRKSAKQQNKRSGSRK